MIAAGFLALYLVLLVAATSVLTIVVGGVLIVLLLSGHGALQGARAIIAGRSGRADR